MGLAPSIYNTKVVSGGLYEPIEFKIGEDYMLIYHVEYFKSIRLLPIIIWCN